MDLGVWMSAAVWRHKREERGGRQAWNLSGCPEGVLGSPAGVRLYVATEGHWRGYFVLDTLQWNPHDRRYPVTVSFAPRSWTVIDPRPAGPRPRCGYTTEVPPREDSSAGGTRQIRSAGREEGNETGERNPNETL
jgi:hypothetical protein